MARRVRERDELKFFFEENTMVSEWKKEENRMRFNLKIKKFSSSVSAWKLWKREGFYVKFSYHSIKFNLI